ncbi:MAG TPA: FecR domain-containing protein, partial [Leptospiraceae bacterium]|nr:FecR domain-containing protein [Leptospiraceae bacterium]
MKLYNFNIFKEISPEEERKDQRKTNTATLSLIFLLVCFLYWDSNKDPEIGNRKLVGKVASAVNQTERKLGATVVWRKIIKDYSVYNYDTIRTEADSKTVIELTDGTKVTLNEDTIIYINTNPEKLDINLIQGSMTVDTMNRKESEVEKINIVHGNEVIKVDRSFLSISKKKSSSSLNLELKEGEALLRKEDKEYILQKGNTVISRKDFIKELNIQYQGVPDERVLAQDFRKSQAEKGRVGGVQIVKSGNQYILLGQDDRGKVKEVR